MVFSSKPGLLPTPNSPEIHSTNMKDYIHRSYYPIPFQAVTIIENLPIKSSPTWELNVATKQIKFKVEWNLADNNTDHDIELFPKPVLNSLSTFNIEKPTWNTTFTGNKLSLKIEWKLIHADFARHNSDVINTSFTDPNSSNCPSMFSTPYNRSFLDSNTDSGYNSSKYSQSPKYINRNRSVNKAGFNNTTLHDNTSMNPSRLFNSPPKMLNRQDTYRPKPAESKESIKTSGNTGKSVNFSENNGNIKSSEIDNVVNIKPSLVSEHASADTSEINVNTANGKIETISTSTDDEELYSDPDYQPYDDFNPQNNSFGSIPKKLRFSNGYLSDDIDAEFMNLTGSCRLCHLKVPSYLAQLHVIECPKSDLDPVHEFYKKFATKLKTSVDKIQEYAKAHQSFRLQDDKIPIDTFKKKEQFKNFCMALDELEKLQTVNFFKKCELVPSSRVINILKYEQIPLDL